MKITDYKEFVSRTSVYPLEYKDSYLTLGIIDEVSELSEKILLGFQANLHGDIDIYFMAINKELGDVAWYTLATLFDIEPDLEELLDMSDFVNYKESCGCDIYTLNQRIRVNSTALAGITKKFLRKDYDRDKFNELRLPILLEILNVIVLIADKINYTLDEVLHINMMKLNKRLNENTIKGNGDDR